MREFGERDGREMEAFQYSATSFASNGQETFKVANLTKFLGCSEQNEYLAF
jgi:hypothetical protein